MLDTRAQSIRHRHEQLEHLTRRCVCGHIVGGHYGAATGELVGCLKQGCGCSEPTLARSQVQPEPGSAS
jgi:hypothetical protein